MRRVCVNCGSNPGIGNIYMEAARNLGRTLVNHGLELIYGGSDVGLMGELANTVMQAGGYVVGVIPRSFAHKVSHRRLTELHVVSTMHERKQMMFNLSDVFIALPGGYGTLEEITEILTWAQLGLHKKPCGILNVSGFFDPLLEFLDRATEQGFIRREHREMLFVSDEPEELLDGFGSYVAPTVEKWIELTSGT